MPNQSKTVTILTRPTREDTRRAIELSFAQKPKIKVKGTLLALLGAALCLVASIVLHGLGLDDISVIFFSASISVATIALSRLLAKWLTLLIARRAAGKRKERALKDLEDGHHPDIVRCFTFGEESFEGSADRESGSSLYSGIHRFEEHGDCFFIEIATLCYIIPARFVSGEAYIALTALLKERCPCYKVVETMRLPGETEAVELPAPPEPLAKAEYTLTDEEKAQVIELSPSCFPKASARLIKYDLRSFFEYSTDCLVALYEDGIVLRRFDSEHRYYYGQIDAVTDAGQFVYIVLEGQCRLYPVPVRALEDKEAFLRLLTEMAEADREGAIQAKFERTDLPDSQPIEDADLKKGRTLLSARFDGMDILYRRRFGVTELIIDGKVYDRSKMLLERDHRLTARVKGIDYTAFLENQYSFLTAGNRLLRCKLRVI